MSPRPGRASTRDINSVEADAPGEETGPLKLDSVIAPTRSRPSLRARSSGALTIREKIARWLEEKL